MTQAKRCIVFGCLNYEGEGEFVGDLCYPCHRMLVSGILNPSSAFFVERINNLEAKCAHITKSAIERQSNLERKYERVMDLAEAMVDELSRG